MDQRQHRWRNDDNPMRGDALKDAMEQPQSVDWPLVLPAPKPHLPLRQASAQRLQARHAPRPLWAPHHQVRGFNPTPVQASPQLENVTASSEHAFAGQDGTRRRPFRPPLGVRTASSGQVPDVRHTHSRPPSSPIDASSIASSSSPVHPPSKHSSKDKSLKGSRSLGEGLKGLRERLSTSRRNSPTLSGSGRSSLVFPRPSVATDEVRDSFRSALTGSSVLPAGSIHTARTSISGRSSQSDFVKISHAGTRESDHGDYADHDMSVEDAIGMYADGFESGRQSMETQHKKSMQEARPSSQPADLVTKPTKPMSKNFHRRSQSASLLDRVQNAPGDPTSQSRPLNSAVGMPKMRGKRTSSAIIAGRIGFDNRGLNSQPSSRQSNEIPRDRYGFKKASHYISVEQYDAWNAKYSMHLERRQKKWQALLQSYGLNSEKPVRFPPKSDKIKRYVRKGIPPEMRGAAWFWYAGGPGMMAKEPGLYWRTLSDVQSGKLTDNDREHIERDLNRTFPDNIRFKPDPTAALDGQADDASGGGGKKHRAQDSVIETPILRSLRRVLQAFAVHNPAIGYCQSLNFIAGLLLVFLDEDEEKAFVLLNVITTTHLPGTHGVALEGANIDIAVLMSCIKDVLPAVWVRLDDQTNGSGIPALADPSAEALRLPTVSLATTAWFMSLFVGTLPIESVLRVWDCLFFEGSKTLFRIALSIFKCGAPQICAVSDPMEIFSVVQTLPRGLIDTNQLMDMCFRRRGGFGHVSQEVVETRRADRRRDVREGIVRGKGRDGWRAVLRRPTKAGVERL